MKRPSEQSKKSIVKMLKSGSLTDVESLLALAQQAETQAIAQKNGHDRDLPAALKTLNAALEDYKSYVDAIEGVEHDKEMQVGLLLKRAKSALNNAYRIVNGVAEQFLKDKIGTQDELQEQLEKAKQSLTSLKKVESPTKKSRAESKATTTELTVPVWASLSDSAQLAIDGYVTKPKDTPTINLTIPRTLSGSKSFTPGSVLQFLEAVQLKHDYVVLPKGLLKWALNTYPLTEHDLGAIYDFVVRSPKIELVLEEKPLVKNIKELMFKAKELTGETQQAEQAAAQLARTGNVPAALVKANEAELAFQKLDALQQHFNTHYAASNPSAKVELDKLYQDAKDARDKAFKHAKANPPQFKSPAITAEVDSWLQSLTTTPTTDGAAYSSFEAPQPLALRPAESLEVKPDSTVINFLDLPEELQQVVEEFMVQVKNQNVLAKAAAMAALSAATQTESKEYASDAAGCVKEIYQLEEAVDNKLAEREVEFPRDKYEVFQQLLAEAIASINDALQCANVELSEDESDEGLVASDEDETASDGNASGFVTPELSGSSGDEYESASDLGADDLPPGDDSSPYKSGIDKLIGEVEDPDELALMQQYRESYASLLAAVHKVEGVADESAVDLESGSDISDDEQSDEALDLSGSKPWFRKSLSDSNLQEYKNKAEELAAQAEQAEKEGRELAAEGDAEGSFAKSQQVAARASDLRHLRQSFFDDGGVAAGGGFSGTLNSMVTQARAAARRSYDSLVDAFPVMGDKILAARRAADGAAAASGSDDKRSVAPAEQDPNKLTSPGVKQYLTAAKKYCAEVIKAKQRADELFKNGDNAGVIDSLAKAKESFSSLQNLVDEVSQKVGAVWEFLINDLKRLLNKARKAFKAMSHLAVGAIETKQVDKATDTDDLEQAPSEEKTKDQEVETPVGQEASDAVGKLALVPFAKSDPERSARWVMSSLPVVSQMLPDDRFRVLGIRGDKSLPASTFSFEDITVQQTPGKQDATSLLAITAGEDATASEKLVGTQGFNTLELADDHITSSITPANPAYQLSSTQSEGDNSLWYFGLAAVAWWLCQQAAPDAAVASAGGVAPSPLALTDGSEYQPGSGLEPAVVDAAVTVAATATQSLQRVATFFIPYAAHIAAQNARSWVSQAAQAAASVRGQLSSVVSSVSDAVTSTLRAGGSHQMPRAPQDDKRDTEKEDAKTSSNYWGYVPGIILGSLAQYMSQSSDEGDEQRKEQTQTLKVSSDRASKAATKDAGSQTTVEQQIQEVGPEQAHVEAKAEQPKSVTAEAVVVQKPIPVEEEAAPAASIAEDKTVSQHSLFAAAEDSEKEKEFSLNIWKESVTGSLLDFDSDAESKKINFEYECNKDEATPEKRADLPKCLGQLGRRQLEKHVAYYGLKDSKAKGIYDEYLLVAGTAAHERTLRGKSLDGITLKNIKVGNNAEKGVSLSEAVQACVKAFEEYGFTNIKVPAEYQQYLEETAPAPLISAGR